LFEGATADCSLIGNGAACHRGERGIETSRALQRRLARCAFTQVGVQRIVADEPIAEWLVSLSVKRFAREVTIEVYGQDGTGAGAPSPRIWRRLL
jgi:hypothetical protein